jgi:hypothetical protein
MKRPEKYEHPEIYPNCYVYKCTDIDPLLDRLDELEAEQIRRNTYPNKVGSEAVRVTADDKWCFNPVEVDKKPFPSFKQYMNDCMECLNPDWKTHVIYNYFAQFQYETKVFPKVGDVVEGEDKYLDGVQRKGVLDSFYIIDEVQEEVFEIRTIRPVSRPTREEVIAQVESKLNSNELTFDRELVEQFLNILKGQ